jgi:hypothetical protein
MNRNRMPACLALVALGLALAGCETTGPGAPSLASAAAPPEPPMTHQRAAEECWMATEKGGASMSLDKRADVVDRCIKDKMKVAPHS